MQKYFILVKLLNEIFFFVASLFYFKMLCINSKLIKINSAKIITFFLLFESIFFSHRYLRKILKKITKKK